MVQLKEKVQRSIRDRTYRSKYYIYNRRYLYGIGQYKDNYLKIKHIKIEDPWKQDQYDIIEYKQLNPNKQPTGDKEA